DSSSSTIETLDYYPYGAERIAAGATSTDRHYIGERLDGDTGLDYLNARYYNSGTGQFLSEDPTFLAIGDPTSLRALSNQDQQTFLADPQQMSSYGYGRDNPIMNKDASGKYVEISGSAVVPGRSFSGGFRFDSNGGDFFMGAGTGYGAGG